MLPYIDNAKLLKFKTTGPAVRMKIHAVNIFYGCIFVDSRKNKEKMFSKQLASDVVIVFLVQCSQGSKEQTG